MKMNKKMIAATAAVLMTGGMAFGAAAEEKPSVSIILDWTPNTNHTGIYVAQELGYYEEAGIDVEILPFSMSGVEPVLVAGEADFGISGMTALIPAAAAGGDIRAVEVLVAKPNIAIGYSAENEEITRPADLEGKVYAGFGLNWEDALVSGIITGDGGNAEYTSVALSTSAYEAVYSGAADFALPLLTWEGIEAELNGTPMSYFATTDYGIPADYPLLIASTDSYLEANPEAAAAFVQATQKGYAYAAENPEEAAKILIDANPEVLKNEELVVRSQKLLSEEYYRAEDGRIGFSDAATWQAFSDFMFETCGLTDAEGNPVEAALQAEDLFTNDFLAE